MGSSSKNGARPTTQSMVVKYVSEDSNEWYAIPKSATITGKIDAQSTAIVLDELHLADPLPKIDLWNYSEFGTGSPLKLQLGASTVCCDSTPSNTGMKSHVRDVVAWGKLVYPYAVYVK